MRFSRVTSKVTLVISYNSRQGMCKLTRPQDPPSRGPLRVPSRHDDKVLETAFEGSAGFCTALDMMN